MGAEGVAPALRIVLDTNVLVSALLFPGQLEWLRRAWQGGSVVPLLSHDTAAELLRVLHYPKFRLSAAERSELLADLLPYCETIAEESTTLDIPLCRDPDDRKFLSLALAAQADALVTGDADLIELAGRCPISILSPARLRDRLSRIA